MNQNRRKLAKSEARYLKRTVAAALCLFAVLFLLPLLLYGGEEAETLQTPAPTAGLPDRKSVV